MSECKQLKSLFFDLGKVIVDFDLSSIVRGLSGQGVFTPELFHEFMTNSEAGRDYMEGRISSETFYSKVVGHFKISISYSGFYDLWNGIFTPNPGMDALIRKISRTYPDIRLILVSDTNEQHFEFIRKNYPVLDECFDHYVLSYRIGKLKPSKEIYSAAIKLAGCLPEKILYTDDRLDLIDASRQFGINSVQFTGCGQLTETLREHGLFNV
ncbi:MAG: HAD family phosphatase [Candidatus Omnitrophica bacterium]|nr:HAD family phosphatase [Candidatus Omnitrophota bacterium]